MKRSNSCTKITNYIYHINIVIIFHMMYLLNVYEYYYQFQSAKLDRTRHICVTCLNQFRCNGYIQHINSCYCLHYSQIGLRFYLCGSECSDL